MATEDAVLLPAEQLHQFMTDVFCFAGVPAGDAKIVADVLIASDLRGIESHGVQRLRMYYDRIKAGILQPVTRPETVKESPTTAVIDGHDGMGHVIGVHSMNLAVQKARDFGMGAVAVRNSSHFGIAGYYALMAVRAGMIGLVVTNTRPSIAPTFGVQPLLGTNPIAFGAPTDEDCPYLFDAATSIIQRGKVEVLARAKKPASPGWVINQVGQPATDADEILKGLNKDTHSLLPIGGYGEQFGGHKGYGLSTVVEILSASLQMGLFLHNLMGIDENGKARPHRIGHFFMAVNIENFLPLAEFRKTTGEILRELRSSRKAPGEKRIYTANEKEYENEFRVRREGVPIIADLQKDLIYLRNEAGLFQYQFPF
ncbi:MAG TPA: Ldh family oxidoreductase [Anaerolineaceae bacterium]|nr:Ldh family oxidoreductase [Anaerolineaceae bacterium]